ncbi:hypothetical protein O3G_MSEX005904 [Manduca sexta]|uniref:Odorant receptor n=2 Tax=Manduca sexta TaxID=7130 RepID=B9VH07_MANSE|nr:putative pheromone receptor OR1 [Manduca sexta]KAG6449169.1 hypothetical protein O3G_MSEX005904 [Manduca sexta]
MIFMDDPLSKSIKDPRDYRYMKLFRSTLRLIGSWPGRDLKEEGATKYEIAPLYWVLVIKITCFVLTIIYLIENTNKLGFFEIGHVYITVFMTMITLSRSITLSLNPKYRRVMTKYITKMHLFYYKDMSDIALKTHIRVHKLSHFFTMYLSTQVVLGTVTFNIVPMYNNYKVGRFENNILVNDSYELSIYFKTPTKFLSTLNGYIAITTFNWYSSYICSNFFCMFDLALSLLIFTVSGHFKILIHNLNNFPLPAVVSDSSKVLKTDEIQAPLYNKTEKKDITLRLKQCIDYHREVLEFTQDISEAFGPMLFVYYLFHQVSGCLLLLECSQMDAAALMRYGLLTAVLFQQLIQLSVVVESVGTVTGYLKDAVYNVPWEYMDTQDRKTVCIFLMNVQEPVHINALGLAKVGVQAMAGILKTSFSYFAFLRTVSN